MKNLTTKATWIAALFVIATTIYAFTPAPTNTNALAPAGGEFLQLTTVESIIPGGLGRSRMFVTHPSGKLEETKIKNFYSMVGINMGNINENDAIVMNKITALSSEGWNLVNVSTGVQSPSASANGGNGEGLYLTRYLFSR